ncbi:MAG: RNA polymerase factor sigma-54 [Alphaproteobacteria bacterium]|nr:RNA polymerase factor sigma-54 [Alphaproteobacteria bacterium]
MAQPGTRSVGPRLDLRQSQTLVMTPQLQQAIKLLQLSNLEVVAYVEAELERNPLLEREEAESADTPAAEREAAVSKDDERPAEPLLDTVEGSAPSASASAEPPLDTDFSNTWDDEPAMGSGRADWRSGGSSPEFEESEFGLDHILSRTVTLREHLSEQIAIDLQDPVDRIIATHLVNQLDEAGYLQADLDTVADTLGCDRARVDETLSKVQRFDPPGLFARSLRECLALQLRDKDRLDPAMGRLIDHLDLLAKREIPALTKLCGVDADDLAEMVAEIKALDPKPGLAFDSTSAQPIVPDVLLRPATAGGWIIELNQDTLPRVLVNQRYYARVSKQVRARDDKDFLAEQLQSANWLVKSLHQRAQTILKVATEIVRQQDAFFAKGIQHLRPLVLRDIATAIEMHESTISRVTTNKFLAAPHGIYELKYFFTSSIADSSGGESHSAEAVRHRIKALIEAETVGRVLSDDGLVDILKAEGIDIARRTVAKYREALRIPSSVQRRREKALGL